MKHKWNAKRGLRIAWDHARQFNVYVFFMKQEMTQYTVADKDDKEFELEFKDKWGQASKVNTTYMSRRSLIEHIFCISCFTFFQSLLFYFCRSYQHSIWMNTIYAACTFMHRVHKMLCGIMTCTVSNTNHSTIDGASWLVDSTISKSRFLRKLE